MCPAGSRVSKTFVGPSILATISFEGGGSVGGAGRSDCQHVEGEGLSAEGVAVQRADGGNAEVEVVLEHLCEIGNRKQKVNNTKT